MMFPLLVLYKFLELIMPIMAVGFAYWLFQKRTLDLQTLEHESNKIKLGLFHQHYGVSYSDFTIINQGKHVVAVRNIKVFDETLVLASIAPRSSDQVQGKTQIWNLVLRPDEIYYFKSNALIARPEVQVHLYDYRGANIQLGKDESGYLFESNFTPVKRSQIP